MYLATWSGGRGTGSGGASETENKRPPAPRSVSNNENIWWTFGRLPSIQGRAGGEERAGFLLHTI